MDRDDGFAKCVDFVVAPQLCETLDSVCQVGPDPIGLGLGIESEPAVTLESVLEVAAGKELVESVTPRRLNGSLSHADTKAQDRGCDQPDQ